VRRPLWPSDGPKEGTMERAPWYHGRRLLTLDAETTSLDTETASVIELAAVQFTGGRIRERRSQLINPGFDVSAETTEITGITNEMLRGMPTVDQVAAVFIRFCHRSGEYLAAHNGYGYDDPVLTRELGDEWRRFRRVRAMVDTWTLVRMDDVGRYWSGKARHKLEAVCTKLELDTAGLGAHRATPDAIRVGRVLHGLTVHRKYGPVLRGLGDTPAKVELALKLEKDKQDENFAAWKAKQPPLEEDGGTA